MSINNKKASFSSYLSASTRKKLQTSSYAEKSSGGSNNGGLLGGIGYMGEKVGLGFLSGLEGIWDFAAGGLADLFGADEWAESQFANDWVNYNHADEWFDPGKGWQVAGDVAGGIGTSLPSIAAAAAITYFSGGSGAGVAAKLLTAGVSGAVAGTAAAGNATKEAYRETGKLTGKEYGYGALSGLVEGSLEGVTNVAGKAGKAIGKSLLKAAGKESAESAAKAVTKSGFKSIGKELAKSFAGEAVEEGISEFVSPHLKWATYDKNAERATLGEIGYSALVGGLSGALMSGGSIGFGAAVNTTQNFFAGKKAEEAGNTSKILDTAKVFANYESEGETGIEAYASAAQLYGQITDSLMKNNGIESVDELMSRAKSGDLKMNTKERMILGKLQRVNTIGKIYPAVEKSAMNLVLNADASSQAFEGFGMTDANGNKITYTAEQITEGMDADLIEKIKSGAFSKEEYSAFLKELRAAIKTNAALATVSVADATGRILIDTKKFEAAAKDGAARMTPDTLAQYKEKASKAQQEAFARDLGYDTLGEFYSDSFEGVQSKLEEYLYYNGEEIAARTMAMSEIKRTPAENVRSAPAEFDNNAEDGVYSITENGEEFAIHKKGSTFRLYSYATGDVSKPMTAGELNGHLENSRSLVEKQKADSARSALSETTEESISEDAANLSENENSAEKVVTEMEDRAENVREDVKDAAENVTEPAENRAEEAEDKYSAIGIGIWARENVSGYGELSEPAKRIVRDTIRQARALGKADSDIKLIATVAARSGLNIVYDASIEGDGLYRGNTIYVKPELSKERTCEVLLGHEMFHKLFASGGKRVKKLYNQAMKLVSDTEAKDIRKRYEARDKKADQDAELGRILSGKQENPVLKSARDAAEQKKNDARNAVYEEEVAAHGAETVFNSAEAWEYILSEEPSFKQKVLGFFTRSVKDYSSIKELSSESRKFLYHYRKLFKELEARNKGNNALSRALETTPGKEKAVTSMNDENMQVTERMAAKENAIYDYNKSFAEQIDDYKKGLISKNDTLLVGETPEIWQKVGFNSLPVTINQTHVDYALNGTKDIDHHIGETLLKDLPNAIKNPIAIIQSQSKNHNDRAVVILKIEHNGKNIIGAIEVDGKGRTNNIIIDSNAITSLFAKTNVLIQLNNAINSSSNGAIELFYWNKKEAISLLQKAGHQLSGVLPQDGFVHSIRDNGSNVKTKLKNVTESQQFKRWFGKSKVVNADGTPKILYHQTANEFTVFDPRHEGAGTNDDETPFGIFMKPTSEDIGLKGKKQMALYARIANPLIVQNRGELVRELQNMSSKYTDLIRHRDNLSVEYKAKIDEASNAWSQYAKDYRQNHPGASRSEISEDPEFQRLFDAEDVLTEEWIEKANKLSLQMKEEITRVLESKGYDGVILKKDSGSFGRSVETYIALRPEQVKSATDNIGTFSKTNPDIRYALPKTDKNAAKQSTSTVADSDKIEVSRGKLEQIRANYKGDMVFYKKDVVAALKGIDALAKLPADMREDITNRLWRGYNVRLNSQGFDLFTETMYYKLHAEILQESGFDMSREELAVMDEQIYAALGKIVESGKTSVRANVKAEVEAEFKRESIEAELKEYKKIVNDKYKARTESREATRKREQVRRQIGRINRLLFNPTKEKNIPYAVQSIIADAMRAEDISTVDMVKLDEVQTELDKLRKKDDSTEPSEDIVKKIIALEAKRDRLEARTFNMKKTIDALNEAYAKFESADDPLAKRVFDSTVMEKLAEYTKIIGDTPIKRMNLGQLNALIDYYALLRKKIDNANQLFHDIKSMKLDDAGRSMIREFDGVHVPQILSQKSGQAAFRDNSLIWKSLKPLHFFEILGSDTLNQAFLNLRAGEDVWARDGVEAGEYFRSVADKYGFRGWDMDTRDTVEIGGRKVQLTLGQKMSLYAYSRRKASHDHLKNGGFIFDPDATYKGKNDKGKGLTLGRLVADSERYTVDEITIMKMASALGLTDEQIGFVEDMQKYLSKNLAEKGNEVSLQLHGIKLFNDEFYLPMIVASEFLDSQTGKTGDPKIKNKGMTKKLTPDAKNPLVLMDFMDVWKRHVNDMALYHGMTLPMEDMNALLNYRNSFGLDADVVDGKANADINKYDSVKEVIRSRYGTVPIRYIEQLLRDLNGGAVSAAPSQTLDKLISKYKKSAVAMSLSVVAQQPSSIARAFSMINPKYFAAIPKLNKSGERWEQVKKYAPVAIIKEIGGFDTGTGQTLGAYITANEYKGAKEKLKGFFKDKDYRESTYGFLASEADKLTWIQIFEACKREQADKHPELKIDSEELLTLAGERFTEVITKTQVYDSTLSRSELMRSKDTGWKMATAFMAEPTTIASEVILAAVQFSRGQKKKLGAVLGSILVASIMNAFLSSFVYAARDDDEDKTYFEKYATSFISKNLEQMNPMTWFPFLKDIYSICQGYDIERTDMAVFADLYNAISGLSSENKTWGEKIYDFSGTFASLFGIPLRNVLRDARGLVNVVRGVVSGEKATAAGFGYAVKEGFDGLIISKIIDNDITNGDEMYKAIIKGDTKHYNRVRGRYKDDSSADTALRTALRDNDPRIEAAAKAKLEGDAKTYQSIITEIANEGKFERRFIVRAATSEYLAIKRDLEDAGYTVFVGDQMYTLSEEQKVALEQTREKLAKDAAQITNAKGFSLLNAEQKDLAMDYAEDLIEDVAESLVLGADNGNTVLLCEAIGINKIAVVRALTKGFESDIGRDGKAVAGSKRAKVVAAINKIDLTPAEKLLLICAQGYTIKDGDIPGVSAARANQLLLRYILSLKISKEKRARLAELCGFTVQNGKIMLSK